MSHQSTQLMTDSTQPAGVSVVLILVHTGLLHFQQRYSLGCDRKPRPFTLTTDTFEPCDWLEEMLVPREQGVDWGFTPSVGR